MLVSWPNLTAVHLLRSNHSIQPLKLVLEHAQVFENHHFCRNAIQYYTQEHSHSGGTLVEFYTTVTLLSTLMLQRWQYTNVTAMAATLVCHRCTLTTVQQRWQWQRCNTTVHTSVTAVTTDSALTAVSTDSAVAAMFTLVWQRCAHHCESSGNWHRWHTNVNIAVTALSAATADTLM